MSERKIDVLVVRWYERYRSDDIVARWLAAARAHLPEAVPVRFGETEPLRGRGGDEDLTAAWAQASPLLFLTGRAPIYHMSFTGGGDTLRGPVAVHSLDAELDPADERVHRFARAVANDDTFYISASVAGGMTLDRKTLWGPAERPGEPYLAPRGDWLGLPPSLPAWHWFGPLYARRAQSRGPWVPSKLQARLDEPDPARRYAPSMPRGLRRSPWRSLIGR